MASQRPAFTVSTLASQVKRYLRRQDRNTRAAFEAALKDMCRNPFWFENTRIDHLKATFECVHKYRLGSHRVMYRVDAERRDIRVVWFGPRGNAPYA